MTAEKEDMKAENSRETLSLWSLSHYWWTVAPVTGLRIKFGKRNNHNSFPIKVEVFICVFSLHGMLCVYGIQN